MRQRSGLRLGAGVLLALALHGLLVVGLLLKPEPPLPREIIFDVVLVPPFPPTPPRPAPPKAPPSRIALQSARQAVPPRPTPPRARPSGAEAWQVRDTGPPEGEAVRRSLRAGVGCRSAELLSLTRAERDACDEKLAAGAKDAPAYAVISPKLRKEFDGVFECRKDDVWCEYRVGKAPYPGLLSLGRKKKRSDWD